MLYSSYLFRVLNLRSVHFSPVRVSCWWNSDNLDGNLRYLKLSFTIFCKHRESRNHLVILWKGSSRYLHNKWLLQRGLCG